MVVASGGGVTGISWGRGWTAAIQCPGRSSAVGAFVPNVSNAAAVKSGLSGRAFLGPRTLSDSGKERATVGSHSFQLPHSGGQGVWLHDGCFTSRCLLLRPCLLPSPAHLGSHRLSERLSPWALMPLMNSVINLCLQRIL